MTQMTENKLQMSLLAISLLVLALGSIQMVEAGQGCPFDDGSCQEYCNQQGCNMGYCGHFAWIQCICRKCGDEWSWYDKVRYNPDKAVNQTELDSLKLNGTTTLILTSGQQQQAQKVNNTKTAELTNNNNNNKQSATLTTLLIPDLSDTSGKLDLNDIPDENSDKFLDYLAKNHEKLVQATSAKQADDQVTDEDSDQTDEEQQQQSSTISTTSSPMSQEERDDELIEIQISSSNNNTSNDSIITSTSSPQQKQQPSTTEQQVASSTPETVTAQRQQQQHSPITRLLRMAVIERASEEID